MKKQTTATLTLTITMMLFNASCTSKKSQQSVTQDQTAAYTAQLKTKMLSTVGATAQSGSNAITAGGNILNTVFPAASPSPTSPPSGGG